MSRIFWNSIGMRRYEVGLDRGVLYIPDDQIAVPWNGLTGVEDASETIIEGLYFNGVKYFDYVTRGDFRGTLKALTYPPEFELFDGVLESGNGIFITGQLPKGTFHLSYRTLVGNDVDGLAGGYKIHVLYGLTAKPSNKTYATTNRSEQASEFTWELSSVPVAGLNLRPTSHIIFDTTQMHENAIKEVEAVLYGSDTVEPRVASIDEFEEMTTNASVIDIFDNGDGTWTAEGSDYFIKKNAAQGIFRIRDANAEFIDANTYKIRSTEL